MIKEHSIIINCKTENEAEILLKNNYNKNYYLYQFNIYKENTCYEMLSEQNVVDNVNHIDYFKSEGYIVINFSDIIKYNIYPEDLLNWLEKYYATEVWDCLFENCKNSINEAIEKYGINTFLEEISKYISKSVDVGDIIKLKDSNMVYLVTYIENDNLHLISFDGMVSQINKFEAVPTGKNIKGQLSALFKYF